MNTKILASCVFLAALSGCATYGSPEAGKFNPEDFGEANRMTYAAMVVDPDPEYDGPMEGSGERAATAVEAYREGSVQEPERVTSTQTR
ncbi:hypothetical protein [Croceicoccus bisphenolivorans]|uniref:hypothetical protein n=1 Tax=Croceicoccus bisphenolivorans TaxID=1783232 RepID=UPI00082DA644|nr:hypothetical protein [Croceicoccus bisphenolivorans]